MIKWITFALQLLMLKKSFTRSVSTMDYIQQTAERARGYFLFAIGSSVSALFLMTSLIVAVIGVGLQIEQQGEIQFSGLIVSATIFMILSLTIFLVSLVLLGFQKKKMAEEILAKSKQTSQTALGPLLEEILKQILLNLSQSQSQKPSTSDQSKNSNLSN